MSVISAVGQTPAGTPLRDKLNINAEENLAFDDNSTAKQFHKESRSMLRKALSTLPQPKNDYEIVVPEDEKELSQQWEDQDSGEGKIIQDQAEIDEGNEAERQAICKDFNCLFSKSFEF